MILIFQKIWKIWKPDSNLKKMKKILTGHTNGKKTILNYPNYIFLLSKFIFSRKTVKISDPSKWPFTFNNVPVAHTTCHKHLGLYLDENLRFYDHINAKISNAHKRTGIIKKCSNNLPRNSFLTIYKSFIRPHLDYCDIIYDLTNNDSFCTKIECI